ATAWQRWQGEATRRPVPDAPRGAQSLQARAVARIGHPEVRRTSAGLRGIELPPRARLDRSPGAPGPPGPSRLMPSWAARAAPASDEATTPGTPGRSHAHLRDKTATQDSIAPAR